jgi:hypothetical protein
MAAGLGFKDFQTGEVLTAADVDGYLMQGVWVFADATARDAAVTSPQEGNFAYLKDTNVTTYYTGSVWANLDTTGMTNPMTTTGDTIYSSSGSTPARLGIGTVGQVLTVNSGATAPEWATPASASPASATNTVATSQSTSSTSYTDLTTSGPEITMTTGTKALVIVTAKASGSSIGGNSNFMSYAVSGATTTSASDTEAFAATIDGNTGNGTTRASSASLATLTAGSNVFTAKYRAGNASSTATFADRSIFVMNLA